MLRSLRPVKWRSASQMPWQRAFPRQQFIHNQSTQASRIDKITSKLPKRLQKYTSGLRNAPLSHIVAFLIMHELTAIIPLFALFGVFHYTNYVPVVYVMDHLGEYVQSGVGRFERYFARKGWFGFEKNSPGLKDKNEKVSEAEVMDRWKTGEAKYQIVVEVAMAYAITKALLPLRIIGSVWATPWFAGLLGKVRRSVTRKI